jgi:bacterioferritin (cytochrome b1)
MQVDYSVPLELAANVLDKLPNFKKSDEVRSKSATKNIINQDLIIGLTARDISDD